MDPKTDTIKHVRLASRYSIIAMFGLFLVVYTTILFVLSRRLKKYFPKFYEKERLKIFVANGIIILAIITRVSVNLWYLNHLQDI